MPLEPPTFADVVKARRILLPHVFRTPLRRHPVLDELVGAEVWVKHENFQILGSFKVRGGVNLVAGLSRRELDAGLITASTGNHGQAIAFAGKTFGARVVIVAPEGANPVKVEAMRGLGADVILHGSVFEECVDHGRALAAREGCRFVHAVDEPALIAGAGTYTLEIHEDLGDIDFIVVPLGGGSGACGACIVSSVVSPSTKVIAVQSEAAPAAYLSWKQKRLVTAEMKTEAEGLATRQGYELPQSILRRLLHDFVLVSEESIFAAIRHFVDRTHTLVEGAGAVALAGAIAARSRLKGGRVVVVATGANVSPDHLRRAMGTSAGP
ncbi:MAG: threonine/serine dehydratase [Gemmatimonadetes bacterium]|nr:threonine/serine dehydratase [Gemmatimonadota bacterium]